MSMIAPHSAKWRARLRLWFWVACVALATPLHPAAADELARVVALAHEGAPRLALHFMDREQPDPNSDASGWMRWERQRIALYRDSREWPAIVARLSRLPDGLNDDFVQWAREQLASAYIAQGQGQAALSPLRQLIWDYGPNVSSDVLARWRRLVIRAYLAGGDVEDARTAMLRYQQDYGAGDAAWRRLQARVLLRGERPGEAWRLLKGDKDPEARALYYLARLRSGADSPRKIHRWTARNARGKHVSALDAYRMWVVAAAAARRGGEPEADIEALSHALVAVPAGAGGDHLFAVTGDQLWRAYLKYGEALGNRMQLLIGRDEDWYDAAVKRRKKDAVGARALFAVLAVKGASPGGRQLGHEQFAGAIADGKGGIALLHALYLHPNPYGRADRLPTAVRRKLVDDALAHADIKLAARLMGDLDTPPKGADGLFWHMRRARILIMGGNYDAGVQALKQLLERNRKMPRKQIDRLMQVLFDLQSVGRDKDAIALFHSLPLKGHKPQLHREVLYWTADSYKALGHYEQAARLYLRSAGLVDPKAMDPWGQTARYQAAEALTKAGLYHDARTIYLQLLKATKDPSRRAVLNSKLQQLWLHPVRKPSGGSGRAPADAK
jgi:tetratricopeptide (TPR) repeat protein